MRDHSVIPQAANYFYEEGIVTGPLNSSAGSVSVRDVVPSPINSREAGCIIVYPELIAGECKQMLSQSKS